jgi:hypothetical protein
MCELYDVAIIHRETGRDSGTPAVLKVSKDRAQALFDAHHSEWDGSEWELRVVPYDPVLLGPTPC